MPLTLRHEVLAKVNTHSSYHCMRHTDKSYLFFSIWSFLIVLAGFWPGYWSHLNSGKADIPIIIHVHAAIFSGWLLLFFIQAYMVQKRKITQHQKFGGFMKYYVFLLVAVGFLTTFVQWKHHLLLGNESKALLTLVAGIRDMLLFGLFFGLAIHHRMKPTLHKIWILGSSAYLLIAAVARLSGFLLVGSGPLFYTLWLMPPLWFLIKELRVKGPHLRQHLYLLILMILGAVSLRPILLLFS